jgi:integrase
MHSAQHTFAICSLYLGMPIEVVSKILGHTDIKTTAIYARIRDGRKEEEMSRWSR